MFPNNRSGGRGGHNSRWKRDDNQNQGGRDGYNWRRGGRGSQNQGFRGRGQYRDPNKIRSENPADSEERKNRPPRESRTMGFRALESLSQVDDVDDIILRLSDSHQGFQRLLETGNIQPDYFVLIVKIFYKICDSSRKGNIIKLIQKTPFLKKITSYIASIEFQDEKEKRLNRLFWNDPDSLWEQLIFIFRVMSEVSPSTSCEMLPKCLKTILKSIQRIEDEHGMHVSDGIKAEVESLNDYIEKLILDNEKKKQESQVISEVIDEEEYVAPRDDYREISVYPSGKEITNKNRGFFLNKNKIKGRYGSVAEYLDVQFRLLREDFVAPLREAICEYKNPTHTGRITNVKFYKNTWFLNMESVNQFQCYRLQFAEMKNKKKLKFTYENSKRFMLGSLVLFTQDNFKSILFGKIAKRNVEDLEKGQIIVSTETGIPNKEPYLMVECCVYFEPYYQVLTVLQNMDTSSFPMERYIINVETETRPPDYILDVNPVFYTIEGDRFWAPNFPNKPFYGLNESQQIAFRAALTKELSIIQGPPGTGKTFVGLKIAQTLLENYRAWFKETPLLLICYTNHALDQFLEGILPFTENILRIGGQSKSETLNKYNIRKKCHTQHSATRNAYFDLKHIAGEIQSINNILMSLEKFDSIISFKSLSEYIPTELNYLKDATPEECRQWLMFGREETHNENRFSPEVDINKLTNIDTPDEAEMEQETNDIEDLLNDIKVEKVYDAILDLNEINKIYIKTREYIKTLAPDDIAKRNMAEYELFEIERDYYHLKVNLEKGAQFTNPKEPKILGYSHPNQLPPSLRWRFYFYWVSRLKTNLLRKKEQLSVNFRETFEIYDNLKSIEDTKVMKEHFVIGMTTTGAARMNSTLKALKCPIVIVEEAAEVLEAHIVTALTEHCQHLILIGDHKQLKPSTADYQTETKFQLGISLFERMVLNGVECHTLNVQHRMRPEISALITPSIYPNLQDHESVKGREDIRGLEKNLFFIDHKHLEEVCTETSKKNMHEATFLISLARHLILNGYEGKQITILAAYLGQMYEMLKLKKQHLLLLKDVRIAVLDNYQGEECDIILLSLVRSNAENSIGFLKNENRVCVALSRARNGFYIMGNMEMLCNNSEVWKPVKETLQQQDAIGESLALVCQVHPHKTTLVKSAEDFLQVPEGGCDLVCNEPMICGHNCKLTCHILNHDHLSSRCFENCNKLLCESNPDHVCKKKCYEECGPCTYSVTHELECGHVVALQCHIDPLDHKCQEPVVTTLPCGHSAPKPCYKDVETFKCPYPCEIRVEQCGHKCKLTCHVREDPDHYEYKCREPCYKFRVGCTTNEDHHRCSMMCFEECVPCLLEVKKRRTVCPHVYTVPCNFDVDKIVCMKPCTKILPCGHKCMSKCEEPCAPCTKKVEKLVPGCDHKVTVMCHQTPDRSLCRKLCPRTLDCGHSCKNRCNEECTPQCREKVDCNITSSCGHFINKVYCYIKTGGRAVEDDLQKCCDAPCGVELKCRHKCKGTCGKCKQGRLHIKCTENCGAVLICGHECPLPCRENCKPCQKKCVYRCEHSKCGKKCGEICTGCKQRCNRGCEHQKCKKLCYQICNIDPCTEPCKKKLKCGHPCVGFCGEPCPHLCRECDADELTAIFFGNEDDENAKFIELQDCKHVLESEGLEQWFSQSDDKEEIRVKTCPKCRTPIINTKRFWTYLKRAMMDMDKVKVRLNGDEKYNEELQYKMFVEAEGLLKYRIPNLPYFQRTVTNFVERLDKTFQGKRNKLVASELNSRKAKLQLLQHMIKILKNSKISNDFNVSESVLVQISMILSALQNKDDRISDQEIEDISLEIYRMEKIVDFENIISGRHSTDDYVNTLITKIKTKLFSNMRFSPELEREISDYMKTLNDKLCTGLNISESERLQIVRALGMRKGHWFKCPNGHIYCITECGGAMEVGRCNECGAAIGGENHALRGDNAHAGEMDGSRYPAWSVMNNLNNFRLDYGV